MKTSFNGGNGVAASRAPRGGRTYPAPVLALFLLALAAQSQAQEVVLQSLSGNGMLSWSNSVTGGACRVEWAPTIDGAWRSSWDALRDIPVTNNVLERPVPMFYRVVGYPMPTQLITNLPAAMAFAVITNRFSEPGFIVLDVRTPSEYSGGHFKTALNVNFYSSVFQQTLAKLDRNRSYLVYCASGNRSRQATEAMRGLNFMDVVNVTEGYGVLAAQPGAGGYVE